MHALLTHRIAIANRRRVVTLDGPQVDSDAESCNHLVVATVSEDRIHRTSIELFVLGASEKSSHGLLHFFCDIFVTTNESSKVRFIAAY